MNDYRIVFCAKQKIDVKAKDVNMAIAMAQMKMDLKDWKVSSTEVFDSNDDMIYAEDYN